MKAESFGCELLYSLVQKRAVFFAIGQMMETRCQHLLHTNIEFIISQKNMGRIVLAHVAHHTTITLYDD
jgi:hypothetical protein